MAKTAAKRAQPRMSGGGRRRSLADSRQMELSFASAPVPATATLPEPEYAPRSYPADLFEACSVDARRARVPVQSTIDAQPAATPVAAPIAANDQIDREAQTLASIVDLLIEMWREASGEDLRQTIFPRQKL